jgi:hypothetical protein
MAAIYQWFGNRPYVNYEHVLLSTNEGWTMRYVGLDYEAKAFSDLGGFPQEQNTSVVSDGKNVMVDSYGTQRGVDQFIWRGNAFSHVHSEAHGGGAVAGMMHLIDNRLVWCGTEIFGHGYRFAKYAANPPYGLSNVKGYAPVDNYGLYIGDIQHSNADERAYGDAFFLGSQKAKTMHAYDWTTDDVAILDSLGSLGAAQASWLTAWNTRVGLLATQETSTNKIHLWTISNLGIIEYKGAVAIGPILVGVGIGPYGTLMTCEGTAGNYHVRSYTVDLDAVPDPTVDLVQEEAISVGLINQSATFWTSPITGRVFFCNTAAQAGLRIYEIAGDATFERVLTLPNYYSFGASGYVGKPVHFLPQPLDTVTNGYSGIKQKLYEAWEMNESGVVNRVGAMNTTVLTPTGTVNSTTGTIGNAAQFTGGQDLFLSIPTKQTELRTVNTFSMCLEATLDSKAADQVIVARCRDIWSTAVSACPDFEIIYDQTTDAFQFDFLAGASVSAYGTPAKHSVNSMVSPTIGQKYHIYVEYDKSTETISIIVDNGTKRTTQLPVPSYFYTTILDATLFFGARSKYPSYAAYLQGSIDQVFWFWDKLSANERSWMYNGGLSRAYSEM